MTDATRSVLRIFLDAGEHELYGFELSQASGLASGTMHPLLARLEACGWLDSRWEELPQESVGRPRRRFYRLTPDGMIGAARELQRQPAGSATDRIRWAPGWTEAPR